MANNEDYEDDDDLTQEEIDVLKGSDKQEEAADDGDDDDTDGKDDGSGDDAGKTDATDDDKDDPPAAEAGDDGSKTVAEADDKPGEGSDQGQGQAGAVEDVEDDDTRVDDFIPGVAAKLPTLSKAELDALDKQLKALDEEFDEGEMTSRVYVAKREEINSKISEHKLALKLNDANVDANWRAAQGHFFKNNPIFKSNSMLASAFQSKVNALLADPSSNSMSDMEILTKCRKELVADLKKDGIVIPGLAGSKADTAEDKKKSAADKAKAIKDAKKAKAGKKGEDLSDLPAEASVDGESWMDKLDKLSKTGKGDAFEEAFEALSETDQRKYLARH